MSHGITEFAVVAALEREVAGLVRGWDVSNIQIDGHPSRIYREGQAVLICAGTGVDRAYTASKTLIENYSPRMLFSIGFAGSCTPDLLPGSLVVPATVTESATGEMYRCAFGAGQLVTSARIAGRALKLESAARFEALAIDMEAAGVAKAAKEYNREFAAIKVISDGVEEDLEFLSEFVTPEGFQTARFVAHIALRPRLWSAVAALNRNSKLATAALEVAVRECLNGWQSFSAKHSNAAAQV